MVCWKSSWQLRLLYGYRISWRWGLGSGGSVFLSSRSESAKKSLNGSWNGNWNRASCVAVDRILVPSARAYWRKMLPFKIWGGRRKKVVYCNQRQTGRTTSGCNLASITALLDYFPDRAGQPRFNRECRLETDPRSGVVTRGGPVRQPNGDADWDPSCSPEPDGSRMCRADGEVCGAACWRFTV